ncbi:hypothetical protein V6N13_004473 [Hibiscus sabdariffa]|uniref:Uncharacterized protein n=1 Tax=Hibiscus sabdariffa TaxID=183260 RepID=A0ABR2RZ36_9ROSI
MFGPVQDVRIPYQQKLMFGFVTFVHPETVKQILARGNPHYICDSRVLVKRYKEKGKVPDKRQYLQQQLERGDFSSCSSPSGLDCREPYDPHVDFKNDGIHRHHRSLSVGASVSLPAYSHDSQNVHPSDSIKQEVSKVNGGNTAPPPVTVNAAEEEDLNSACVQKGRVGSPKAAVFLTLLKLVIFLLFFSFVFIPISDRCHGSSIEHALPDSPFASPEKSTETHLSEFPVLVEAN